MLVVRRHAVVWGRRSELRQNLPADTELHTGPEGGVCGPGARRCPPSWARTALQAGMLMSWPGFFLLVGEEEWTSQALTVELRDRRGMNKGEEQKCGGFYDWIHVITSVVCFLSSGTFSGSL